MSGTLQNKLYTLTEVAEITGLSARNLRDWAYAGRVAAMKRGRQWYMNQSQIRKLLEDDSMEQEPESDVLENIDLADIEVRIADLYTRITGKMLDNDDRNEILSILEDYMRIALEGSNLPRPIEPDD